MKEDHCRVREFDDDDHDWYQRTQSVPRKHSPHHHPTSTTLDWFTVNTFSFLIKQLEIVVRKSSADLVTEIYSEDVCMILSITSARTVKRSSQLTSGQFTGLHSATKLKKIK